MLLFPFIPKPTKVSIKMLRTCCENAVDEKVDEGLIQNALLQEGFGSREEKWV